MQGQLLVISVHLHGTLAANALGRFELPCDATLKEVHASAANDSDATLDFGPAADGDGIIDGVTIGDSAAVKVMDRDDWNGDDYTDTDNIDYLHYSQGQEFQWTLDFDGAAGTAAQNVDLAFVFIQ